MVFKPPKKLDIAQLPTPIQPMNRMAQAIGVKGLYVKRDDLTGLALSGNKIRKLEYLLADAKRKKATVVMTCGAVQSNHCRATAVAAVQLGIVPYLILRGKKYEMSEGNLFLDKLLGAKIKFVTSEEYGRVGKIMEREAKRLERKGEKVYQIPVGGSNDVGTLGYIDAVAEIKKQERQLKTKFDYVVTAAGSGGTLSGLVLGKKIHKLRAEVLGVNISGDTEAAIDTSLEQIKATRKRWRISGLKIAREGVQIIDGYVGAGYAIPYDENLDIIKQMARLEGIFLDPVYGSKAFYGMCREIEKGNLPKKANYLFIHTGGIFGLLAQKDQFDFL